MTKYKLENKIKRKGYPTNNKNYPEAHEEASNAEKKKYPAGYQKLKQLDKKTPNKQLIGKNTKSGKIEVSKKVPKKERQEVAFHEKYEHKALHRLSKRKPKYSR